MATIELKNFNSDYLQAFGLSRNSEDCVTRTLWRAKEGYLQAN